MKDVLRRNVVHLLIAAVLYFNLAALLRVTSIRFPSRSPGVVGTMPNHWVPQRIFRMFGVFSTAIDHAFGYSAMGVRERLSTPPATIGPDMIDLDVYRYFPFSRGVAHQWIYLHGYYGDKERRERAFRRMADVILERHNERHPDSKVTQVFLFQHWWPKSHLAYDARIEERQTLLLGHN